MIEASKSIAKKKTNEKTAVDARAEVSRGTIISLNTAGVVIGLWSFASLVGGMVAAGGPVALVKAWFGAVAGL